MDKSKFREKPINTPRPVLIDHHPAQTLCTIAAHRQEYLGMHFWEEKHHYAWIYGQMSSRLYIQKLCEQLFLCSGIIVDFVRYHLTLTIRMTRQWRSSHSEQFCYFKIIQKNLCKNRHVMSESKEVIDILHCNILKNGKYVIQSSLMGGWSWGISSSQMKGAGKESHM